MTVSPLGTCQQWLSTKVHIVKAMVYPVVMYGYESWSIRRLSAKESVLSNCGAGEDP